MYNVQTMEGKLIGDATEGSLIVAGVKLKRMVNTFQILRKRKKLPFVAKPNGWQQKFNRKGYRTMTTASSKKEYDQTRIRSI
jgi:hypothetical protein